MKKYKVGAKFNDWTIVKFIKREKFQVFYLCKCTCGAEKICKVQSLARETCKNCKLEEWERNQFFAIYRTSAKDRKIVFDLTKENFARIIKEKCYYCGNPPLATGQTFSFSRNGLDRKDSKQGYTLENVLPCCIICNRAKNNMSYNDFLIWIKKVRNHLINENEK